MTGPVKLPASSGSPMRRRRAAATSFSAKRSKIDSATRMRPAETQRWPLVLKALMRAQLTARSSRASAQTMTALLLPISQATMRS